MQIVISSTCFNDTNKDLGHTAFGGFLVRVGRHEEVSGTAQSSGGSNVSRFCFL